MRCTEESFLPTTRLLPFWGWDVKVQNFGYYGRKQVCVGAIVPFHRKL